MGKRRKGKNQKPALNGVVSSAIEEIRESGRYVEVSLEHRTSYNTCALFEGFAYCVEDNAICLLNNGSLESVERLPLPQIKNIDIVGYGLMHSHEPSNTQLGYVGNHK